MPLHNFNCLETWFSCCAVDDLLHSIFNPVLRQRKLDDIFIFGNGVLPRYLFFSLISVLFAGYFETVLLLFALISFPLGCCVSNSQERSVYIHGILPTFSYIFLEVFEHMRSDLVTSYSSFNLPELMSLQAVFCFNCSIEAVFYWIKFSARSGILFCLKTNQREWASKDKVNNSSTRKIPPSGKQPLFLFYL